MTLVSSKMTFFYKRIFPALLVLPLLAIVVAAVPVHHQQGGPPLPFFIGPVFIGVIFFMLYKELIFDLVDEVWDDGDALIVRNGGMEERIPLKDIKNVSYSPLSSPARVTLSLRQPGKFGSEVSFLPPFEFIPFKKSPIVEELIDRIDAARRR